MSTPANAWSASMHERWARIAVHRIGGESGAGEFVHRLMREQSWTGDEARSALREYRRFVFLACVAGHEVTPSPPVDEVWHLHLLHTRDYWLVFCPQVLGTSLHHSPAAGAAETPRYRAQYAQTLASYARWFGPPPRCFWPRPPDDRCALPADEAVRAAARVTPRASRGRGLRTIAGALGLALPALLWAATPANPLDWVGPEFIALYLVLLFAAVVLGVFGRAWLRRRADSPNRNVGALVASEVAYLAGGPQRAIDASVAELHQRGVVAWDDERGRFYRTDSRVELESPLDTIATSFAGDQRLDRALAEAARAIDPIRAGLERRGLWLSREAAHRISMLSALPAAALCGFGLLKIGVGISRGKPIGLLVILCLLTAGLALALYFSRPGRSRAGDIELRRLRAGHPPPRHQPRGDQIALAVALGGTAVLTGTALAAYHQARAPVSSADSSGSGSDSSDSSSSDSSSDSGGGSSCGGCGGGGGD